MKGIRLKLFIYISLLMILLLLFNILLQSSILNRYYSNTEKDKLISYAQIIEKNLLNPKELSSQIDRISSNLNARVSIYDDRGNIIYKDYSHMMGMTGKIMNIEKSNLELVLKGQVIYRTDEVMLRQSKIISLGYPAKVNGTVAAIFIHIPTVEIKSTVENISKQFTYLLFIAILISFLGAYILSNKFTKPILDIKNAAKKISEGNYDVRLNIATNDEIEELSNTINVMSENLTKTEKLRRDFIANVTHEFRTPLGIIKGYAEALYDDIVPEDEKKQYIEDIIEEVGKLNRLVNENLELSKIESKSIKLNFQNFNLYDLLKDIVDKVKIIKGNRRINLSGEDVFINGDMEYLERAILNIISNSIKHTKDDGLIEISLKSENKTSITIKDDGEGIEKEHLPYIFERFYRAKEKGTGGLGLSIAKEIIKLHGGEIKVISKLGEGSVFEIKLPC
ncbi:Signal transduction histidine kinase [Caloramator quimbayensis]|uniref:histidine kinase n=1 Tax=Caloramator quimbayensis TaxID=1147123 RepID=A0A1T4X0G7_9CLOT|nr:HAMP domain-containing sensor histidine kinase [Caloramator quimbayensis]SKA83102.1 Signal transduction histidine kinase [Caloramator quimbayensis]